MPVFADIETARQPFRLPEMIECTPEKYIQREVLRLRALAENADVFVVAWLSAKHAATEFIREHRGSQTLLYAQGRGFSSILRALEDHFGRN